MKDWPQTGKQLWNEIPSVYHAAFVNCVDEDNFLLKKFYRTKMALPTNMEQQIWYSGLLLELPLHIPLYLIFGKANKLS